ncbi:peptidase [Paenibacillus sp. KQZ6P-2]|uniref:Peptidase n=1 Tax=Paenibacillus mangrovi TaxID=2931978 RepID=A0A9X2B117_9BACL|nr:peptidase [Paenibacillus mangrovi]MCJ8010846.1 peptidase [Paenibacillus mangrovi]
MKKFYKVLTTATLLAMAAMPMAASAHPASNTSVGKSWEAKEMKHENEQHENKKHENEQHEKEKHENEQHEKEKHDNYNEKREKEDKHDCDYPSYEEQSMLSTLGQITKITNDASGKNITVTGHRESAKGQDEITLAITKDTKIVNSKGKQVNLKDIMDGHQVVKAVYNANLTKSVPARGVASKIIVQDQNQQFTGIQGKVTDVKNGKFVVTGKNLYTAANETIVVHVTGKTQIVDRNGKKISQSDVKPGMEIKAFYGPQITRSLPAQSNASYIIVNTEDRPPVEQSFGTEGVITGTNGSQITVVGKGLDGRGQQQVVLNINKDTRIEDRNGNVLSKDVLKENVLVEATYGPAMTFSIPPMTNATKIVVKDTLVKAEGTVKKMDTDKKSSLIYLDVNSDNEVSNDVILNVTDQTKIVSQSGDSVQLTPGTKVVAYHSMIMTRSLPPISNAEVIITGQTR